MSNTLIDITGMRFGKLIAIGRSKTKRTKWVCLCDCGTQLEVEGYELRKESGGTRGCRPCQTGPKQDLTGQKFGALKALRYIRGQGWECLCDCGNLHIVEGAHLFHGRTTSCGCKQYDWCERQHKLIGMTFGSWTVKAEATTHGGTPAWLCICTCGTKSIVKPWALMHGKSLSCGCKVGEMASARMAFSGHEAQFRAIYRSYKYGASSRSLEFALDMEQVRQLIFEDCIYCGGKPLSRKASQRIINVPELLPYNGIDRIDSIKGYSTNNCVSCCAICNRAKSTLTYEQFISYIALFSDQSNDSILVTSFPERLMKLRFRQYKANARRANRPFELNRDCFISLVTRPCRYCCAFGFKIINGVDRIDNTVGYIPTNCVSCCVICNRAKSDMSLDDFLIWTKQLSIQDTKLLLVYKDQLVSGTRDCNVA